MTRYLVAAAKPWNREAFERHAPALPGEWRFVSEPDDLTPELLCEFAPRYVFFPHWSVMIPPEVFEKRECVLFHMTDLPFGRGGSPLQNLIASGHTRTMLSAIRVQCELDAGPIYMKLPLSLEGTAHDIFIRMADLVWDMIASIVAGQPSPVPQAGEPSFFRRRSPEQSMLPHEGTAMDIYDHIRMLDAPTYPRAFLDHGAFRLEFSNARVAGGDIIASVRIRPRSSND